MADAKVADATDEDLAARLLAWYDRNRRHLPWRAEPGERIDPYRVWLSEIMLQQTTVAAVKPYFEAFLARWPTVEDLAAADLDAVLHAWQGLGYYARARNLHRAAQMVVAEHGGRFPASEAALRMLPGVGTYTAAAIAAIAFGAKATPVDGNIERVVARLHGVATPLPDAKPELRRLAALLTPEKRAGDYAQAVMDLGATICTPRSPDCGRCPWSTACAAYAGGQPESLPARAPKRARTTRRGVVFWTVTADGQVLLRRRPDEGLLGGMMEVPSTPWRERDWSPAEAVEHAPLAADWRALPGSVAHGFTHFPLELQVFAAELPAAVVADGIWWPIAELDAQALPTLTKKVVRHALAGGAAQAELFG